MDQGGNFGTAFPHPNTHCPTLSELSASRRHRARSRIQEKHSFLISLSLCLTQLAAKGACGFPSGILFPYRSFRFPFCMQSQGNTAKLAGAMGEATGTAAVCQQHRARPLQSSAHPAELLEHLRDVLRGIWSLFLILMSSRDRGWCSQGCVPQFPQSLVASLPWASLGHDALPSYDPVPGRESCLQQRSHPWGKSCRHR